MFSPNAPLFLKIGMKSRNNVNLGKVIHQNLLIIIEFHAYFKIDVSKAASRKRTYIILTPLNPTFI